MENAETKRMKEAKAFVGHTLRGKWHIDAVLGIGGMATVYAATHRNGRRVAVKVLHRDADLDTRCRFLREGRITNGVEHDGVVSVIDDDIAEDGSAFLVMELLEGEVLSERAAKTGHKLSAEQVLLMADRVLDALAAAHDKGIVHRDVKPENIFLTTSGQVKLLDFGIAHLTEASETRTRTTLSGTAMGTPAFASPEQARGRWELVGPQSDLWSVGATMFTLLTGEFVHEEETLQELLAAVITKPARSLADALPGAPTPVVEVVDRALERALSERWLDARDMQAAVRWAYRAIGRQETSPQPKRWKGAAALVAAALGVVAVGVTEIAAVASARPLEQNPRALFDRY